jgi:ssDNA-binding Zn-finger/Zn-ribbon topoisomerase 1
MLLDLFFDSLKSLVEDLFSEKSVGEYGEDLTERQLKIVKTFGKKNGKILRNIYIPKDDGGTTEIDIVFISQKGIFVIESKNYSGWIFGDEKSAYWMQMLPNKQKNQFYNPILQNRNHIKWLKNYLWINGYNDVSMYSFIVFSERCELKKMSVVSNETRVMKRNKLYANIMNVWDSSPDVFDETQVAELFVLLKQLTKVTKAQKQAHIDAIHDKYAKKPEAVTVIAEQRQLRQNEQPEIPVSESDVQHENAALPPCPKCGGALVLRVSSKGENAGKQFYGCSHFPKCRFIQNISQLDEQPSAEKTADPPMQEHSPICPKCGSALVLRVSRKGENAGRRFYGCSNFPKCRYIQNI